MKTETASTFSGAPREDNSPAIRSITRRYWTVWAFYGFGPSFIFAIYPLFLRSRGLNQFQVNVVAASYLVVTFLTDVPTGAFADAVGRRASVVIGCLFHIAAFLLYFVSYHYWHFIVAEILDGFGTTFGNGPIDAWAVDALDAAGFDRSKDPLFARQFQIQRITGMSGALIGSYVAQHDIAMPFLLSTFAWMVATVASFLLMDRTPPREVSISGAQILRDIRRKTTDSTQLGFANRGVRLISTATLISSVVWTGWWLEWQQYFNQGFGTGINVVGWVFVGISLAQMAGAEIAARVPWAWERRAGFVAAMSAIASASLVAAGLARGHIWLALEAILVAHLVSGAIGPMLLGWFNEMIEGNRATLLSFQTSAMTLGGAVGQPIQGKMVDLFGTAITWQFAGLISLTQTACFIALGREGNPPVAEIESV